MLLCLTQCLVTPLLRMTGGCNVSHSMFNDSSVVCVLMYLTQCSVTPLLSVF